MSQSQQSGHPSQHPTQQSLPRAVIVIASLALAGLTAVANAQTQTGPQYVSPRVQPRAVTVVPPRPEGGLAVPGAQTPMMTVPEGGRGPTQAPPPRRPTSDPVIQTEKSGESSEAIGLISDPIVNVGGLTSAANP